MARMPSSTWTSVRGWLELYLSIATECARSTEVEETISGNSAAMVGNMSDSRRELNQARVRGIFLTQSPPSLYFPEAYSLLLIPSSLATATAASASSGGISGLAVTRIRSSGNLKASAKSSGGTDPIEWDRASAAPAGSCAPGPQ